jgi:hypothetical protein
MFNIICKKAGLELEKGFGWHSIRRTVTSVMRYVMPANGVEASLWAEYTGWSKTGEGEAFFGSAMMGYYTHSEVLNSDFMRKLKVLTSDSHGNDPYWIDTTIFLVHPFLTTWEKALSSKPRQKKTVANAGS